MKRCMGYGLAPSLLAAVALGAVLASSAVAAEWLLGAEKLEASITGKTTAEGIFEDRSFGMAMSCSAVYEGNLGPGGNGTISTILNLSGGTVSSTNPLACGSFPPCERNTAQLIPHGLPWKTTLILLVGGGFEQLWFSSDYTMECSILGVLAKDECTVLSEALGGTGFTLINAVPNGVEIVGESEPHPTCTLGGKEAGLIYFAVGAGLITTPEFGTLTVSE